jgi:predicted site-specific integrase-resolvase
VDLARRWKLSPRTLERWRWKGEGPVFLRVGGRVIYRLEDIETFEAASVRNSTST